MLDAKDCRFIEVQLTRALREGRDRKVLVSLSNGQHYEFSAREGSQELGVITFEDVTPRVEAEEKIRSMARYRQPDRAAKPRLFPRDRRRGHGDRGPRPAVRPGGARPRRLQERQRHARPSGRRWFDLCGGRKTGRLCQRDGQGQPLRRRRVHDLLRPGGRRKPSCRHARPHIRRAAGRGRRRGPRAAHSGQRRRGAVAGQGHRCRRHDRQGRPRALQGQGTRQERLAAVRSGDGRRIPQPPADEGGSAHRHRGQCAARRLSADRVDGHDADRQLRSALPLGSSGSRPDLARRLHPAGRGDGHHFRDQHLHAACGLRRMRPMAGADQRVGQSVGQGFPQPRCGREGSPGAGDIRTCARTAWRSR